ncbi:MAG: alpha/beta hydrolase [Candidatus Kapabacteria bacterium]|nr:alpha/beta hydrolase [Candidatus Kapabacteria bacterium]
MIVESVVSVPNRHARALHTTVTIPTSADGQWPLVVILHGHKGFRNYGFLPWIAQGVAASDMIAIRMCFSLNGMDNTSWLVQRPDDFASNTLTCEVDDVHDLLQQIQTHDEFSALRACWNGRLAIVGHSRGGGIAQVAGREIVESGSEFAKWLTVIGLNSVGNWTRWTPRQAAAWRQAGHVEVNNQRTGQTVRIDSSFLDDVENNEARLSLTAAVQRLDRQMLFIHAAQDLTVPIAEVQTLASHAPGGANLVVIDNTTHTFGMTHPVERITSGFLDAFTHIIDRIGQ